MYRVKEISDVFVDACLRNEAGELMFLSCYGRDTALQQLFASFSLGVQEGGLMQFHLVEGDAPAGGHRVHVGAHERLTKFSGRLPRGNLFGNLSNTWIYDPALRIPDRSNQIGWVMHNAPFGQEGVREQLLAHVWSLYKLLSPVPMLDDWMEVVIRATKKECVVFLDATDYPPIGPITAVKVSLPEQFTEMIARMVKTRMIGLAGEQDRCLASARARVAA